MAKAKQNLRSQEIGNKGALTHARILKATASLMAKRSIRDLKVAEIGSLAAVSASTFYVYFESVPDAALAVVEELDQATPEVMAILGRAWTRETVFTDAKALVQAYMAYWDDHHAILHVRNFVADEGDRRFLAARRRSSDPIHIALQAKIRQFQATDPQAPKLHPPSAATVLMATLERTSAIVRFPSTHKATRPRQIETVAFLIASVMVGAADGLVASDPLADAGRDVAPRGRARGA